MSNTKTIVIAFAHVVNLRFDWLVGEVELTVTDPGFTIIQDPPPVIPDILQDPPPQLNTEAIPTSPIVQLGEHIDYGKSITATNMQKWNPE